CVARARGRNGGVAGAAELARVERQEQRPLALELRRDIDEVRIDREMGKTAAIGEERLARVAIGFVLPDGVFDVLSVQPVLQFGGEDRNPVQEKSEIEAVLILQAVTELAHLAEDVRGVELRNLFVQSG